MASWIDLSHRLEIGLQADDRLHGEAVYHGGRVPRWLADPMDAAAANAGDRLPVVVVNCKHHSVDGALVVISLIDFERLLGDG